MTDNNIYRNKYYLKQTPETERAKINKVRGRERERGRERARQRFDSERKFWAFGGLGRGGGKGSPMGGIKTMQTKVDGWRSVKCR